MSDTVCKSVYFDKSKGEFWLSSPINRHKTYVIPQNCYFLGLMNFTPSGEFLSFEPVRDYYNLRNDHYL